MRPSLRALTGATATVGLVLASGAGIAAADVHEVQPGDTLTSIARTYDAGSWQELAERNDLDDPDLIRTGEVLTISGSGDAGSSATPTGTWDRLAECESGQDWGIDTGNGYYGGLQFKLSSWEWVGGSGLPSEASREEQIERAEALLELQGWGAWPACSTALGLR